MYLAHAFGQRYELPLPLILFVLGGAFVVGLSFLFVMPRAVTATETGFDVSTDAAVPVRTSPVLGAGAVLVLTALITCGILGSQEVAENIVPTWFWLVVWIALPLSCGVLGDWTRALNPFAALARVADSASLRRSLLGSPEPVGWPRWLGWWPAVLTFFLAASGELVYNQTATLPRVTAYALLAFALISLAAGLLFGAPAWLGRGEMFSVLFSTWGRLGFWRFGAAGRRGFAGGLDVAFEPVLSRVVFVMMLLVSVSFDGLISTPSWRGVHHRLASIGGHSPTGVDSLTTLAFLALALMTLVVFAAFALAAARAGGRRRSALAALADLLPSLTPIAFGYLLAHNLEYLVVNGQLLIPLIGNPSGLDGGQWLPAPFNDDYEPRPHLLPSAFYWYLAVAVIIAVHIVAVVIAHRHLAVGAATKRQARHSEYPWVVAMIAYTMVSLWLLAQPLVKDKPTESTTSSHGASVRSIPGVVSDSS